MADARNMLDAYLRQQLIASTLASSDAADAAEPPRPIELPDGEALAAFKAQVQAYMEVDDKLRKLHAAAKELNRNKKTLGEQILAFMARYNIEDLNTRNGKLRYRMTFVKVPASQKEMRNRFMSAFDATKTAEEISRVVFDARERIARASLRRLTAPPREPQ